MYVPGVDTYFPHWPALYEASKLIAELSHSRPELSLANPIVSCSAFEAYLNDLSERLLHAGNSNLQAAANFLKDAERDRIQIKSKVSHSYYIINTENIDRGSLVFQNFSNLVDLRNLLAHAKGEWIKWNQMPLSDEWIEISPLHVPKNSANSFPKNTKVNRDKRADRIIKFLSERSVININHEYRMAGWVHVLSNPNVARWSHDSSAAMRTLFKEAIDRSK